MTKENKCKYISRPCNRFFDFQNQSEIDNYINEICSKSTHPACPVFKTYKSLAEIPQPPIPKSRKVKVKHDYSIYITNFLEKFKRN